MKHKVWSKKFNCWMDKGFFDKHYESGMVPDTFINSEGILVFVYSGFSTHVVDPDEYVIVWSTGLRDRNGKEIYEGDIVRGATDIFNQFTGKVVYAYGRYVVDGVGKYKNIREELDSSFEVIGTVLEGGYE